MLEFDDAQNRLAQAGATPESTETVALHQAPGRILARNVTAVLDLPPADNSAMDGYAVRHVDLKPAAVFCIQQRCYAGDTPQALQPGKAIRLYTGSLLPQGADTIIMQEDASEDGDTVRFRIAPAKGSHVRWRGEDVSRNTRLLAQGTRLGAGEIALLASQGLAQLEVYPALRIGILTTGDELVAPGQPRGEQEIYNSNAPMLAAMAQAMGIGHVRVAHARDDESEIAEAFRALQTDSDIILSVGGVSVGDKDLVKPVLEQLGAELALWRVRMKPGRPVALAHLDATPVVGLPGNPVSAFVVFALLVSPLIRRMQGRSELMPAVQYGRLITTRRFGSSREEFIRVQLRHTPEDRPELIPHADQGSAIISSLSWADGLARIPADGQAVGGDTVAFYPFAGWLS